MQPGHLDKLSTAFVTAVLRVLGSLALLYICASVLGM
jgi:hypothetical protein